jgi:Bromodomain
LDRVREVLEQIRRLPEAIPFLEPVDSSAPGCETYYAEIKQPRNLGTICGHLGLIDGTGYYESVDAVVRDVSLVWLNCFQFNPTRDQICDYARVCKTRFEVLMERSSRADSSSGVARKSSRSTQGIHTRLLSDDRSVAELRRKKRMKVKDVPAPSNFKFKESKNSSRGVSTMVPNKLSGPGAELVGRSLLVFCGLSFPGMDSEAVRWHQCKVLKYNETDQTHDVLWGDFGMQSSHISFYTGSDYCIFKDRGVAS